MDRGQRAADGARHADGPVDSPSVGRVERLDDVPEDELRHAFARQLARQGRLLRWAPVWYVLPLIVVSLSFLEGIGRLQDEHAPMGLALPIVGFGIAVAALNVRTARKLEQRRAALLAWV